MSFTDIKNLQLEYRTLEDEVITSFYVPCLKEAVVYKRAVGFFSSSILLQISKGLGSLAIRGGKIKLLVSPKLDKEDYEAIKKGYELKDVVYQKMNDSFDENIIFAQKVERFTLLSFLISHNILDIQVAVVKDPENDNAMFHEKLGIMIDADDNIISFAGSSNETAQGFKVNYECIDVFCSWQSIDAEQRCSIKDFRFDRMWDNDERGLTVIPFPKVIEDKIIKYNKYDQVDFIKLDEELEMLNKQRKNQMGLPTLNNVSLYLYQQQAIQSWVNAGYRGIFDMATGTGKTFTGLGALTRLFSDKQRLVAIICCPYIHLVEQWAEEVTAFGIIPIKCYGAIKYQDKLKRQLMKFNRKRTNFVCVITTNATFQMDDIQNLIDLNIDNTLLMVDEAHNFGAYKTSKFLNKNYPYRLALSATVDRYGDAEGTKRLYDFFGNKCIEYSLSQAIQEGKLTPYKYYPILVNLSEDEFDRYQAITEKIKAFHCTEDELRNIPDALKKLLIARARIVAGAENKVNALKNALADYKDKSNILVYCGAVKYGDFDYENDVQGKRQIKVISEMISRDLGMVASRFTAEENGEQRKNIIRAFKDEELQALVAIKCLDEGVNVPAIKTAFILASSTNPKEYIQRRGRVLRKYPGKEYAEIYDFITLPRQLDTVDMIGEDLRNIDVGLVKKELKRLLDFAALSSNPTASNSLINEIEDAYQINKIDIEEANIYE